MKKIFTTLFFLLLFFIVKKNSFAEISLESYCQDGYYKIPKEAVCSRAPNCGGKSYDEVKNLPMPNPQECMGDDNTRTQKGCNGYVPLCCYEMARKGNFTYCIGYWERLWCSLDLCQKARENGASEADCGGNCQCGHAFEFWCDPAKTGFPYKNAVPLEIRLGLKPPTPTIAPTKIPTLHPTSIPTITSYLTHTPFQTQPSPSKILIFSPIPTKQPFDFFSEKKKGIIPTNASSDNSTSPTHKINFNINLKFPTIKTNYDKQKIESEVGKFLDFFSFIFYTIKDLDRRLEEKINQNIFLLFPFNLTK